MSMFLFPAGSHAKVTSTARHKPVAIPRLIFHTHRAAIDAADALSLFLDLLHEKELNPASPGFLAFDAHVGDTSCQLRACMVLEIVNRYRRIEPNSAELRQIQEAITRLRTVAENTRVFCKELCDFEISKASSEKIGIPKNGLSVDEMMQRLGWLEKENPNFPSVAGSLTSVSSVLSLKSSSNQSRGVSDKSSAPPSVSAVSTRPPTPGTTTPASSVSSSPVDTTEQRRLASPFSSEVTSKYWMPWNLNQVVHFLVYCYVLSKYKQFIVRANIYGAGIKPELAFQISHKLIDGNFPKPYLPATKKLIEVEFQVLQGYVSELSCAWLSQTSRMFCPDRQVMTSLLENSRRSSPRGLTSVSTYLGYLVLRELWAQTSVPMFMVTKRFCDSGFHLNVFKVRQIIDDQNDHTNFDSVIRPNISWKLHHISGDELVELRKCSRPHIFVSGNSIEGETPDYLQRLPDARIHASSCCSDNEAHIAKMLSTNQDQLALSLFADHRHYAFPLSGEETQIGEDEVVKQVMDEVSPGLSQQWQASKDNARIIGTGPSLVTCMWQHVALESPARALYLLEREQKPIILGAPVIDFEGLGIKKGA